MNYQDNFSAIFRNKESFLDFLDQIEKSASWEKYLTSRLQVICTDDEPEACQDICLRDDGEGILRDTCANTGLLLKTDNGFWPVGSSAIKTLENRARISGYALQDLERSKLARVLNDCLEVTKGRALLRIHEGKVRAVHGGDQRDYAVLPMPELFEAANDHIVEQYDQVSFLEGHFEHSIVTASWQIQDQELLNTYQDVLLQYGLSVDPATAASIRVQSSDVGISGANIYYSLLMGDDKKPLILGDTVRLEHSGEASLEDFLQNLNMVFARYREAVEGLARLFTFYVTYPANVIAGLMKKAGIGVGLTAKTAELFRSGHGCGSCNGYEVYCGICECIFLAQSEGAGVKTLTDLEEKVSRCLTFRFQDFDIPGLMRY